MKKMGYVIGLIIGIPLFILIVNFFFFRGNNPKELDINDYISNSIIDTIVLPQSVKSDYEQYIVGLNRRGNPSAFLQKFYFFDKKHNKNFVLLIFRDLDSKTNTRSHILRRKSDGDLISINVNKKQLSNPNYGTIENPIPVFPKDILNLEGGFTEDPFHVSPELNYIFVEQYLKFFMPKNEFQEMFRK